VSTPPVSIGRARLAPDFHVVILFEPVNDERLPVVTADFSHTQRRMKRKLGIVIDIDLSHDIRWWVVCEVKLDSVPDKGCTLNVRASVGFRQHRECFIVAEPKESTLIRSLELSQSTNLSISRAKLSCSEDRVTLCIVPRS